MEFASNQEEDWQMRKGLDLGWWPNIQPNLFRITSRVHRRYNCIAWAAGVTNMPWEPGVENSYWPDGIPQNDLATSYIAAFGTIRYCQCEDGSLEPGYEKVALFVDANDEVRHIARQLPNGKWTSKIGKDWEDVEHDTVEVLEGDPELAVPDENGEARSYGRIGYFLERLRTDDPPVPPIPVNPPSELRFRKE